MSEAVPGGKPTFFEQIRGYPSSFWVANTMEIFERMAWYGFFALSSLYITGAVETGGLGFTSEQRGAIQAIIPFILYLLPVLTGALADRYGFKRMFIISYVSMMVFYYLLGQFKTLPGFLLAFFFVAIAAAIFKPVVVGTVARLTDERNSRMGFGIFYMMVNVGGFLGPIVAGLVRGVSWEYVFIASSGWAAINLLICILFYREPPRPPDWKPRRLAQVGQTVYEVLGNLRFFLTIFVTLIAMMIAQFGPWWFQWYPHAAIFIPAWLILNFLWDVLLPAGSGRPGAGRGWLAQRMHCSDWRFALYLLILSGFWTSFNQIFLTMPEYIRDFTETKPLVDTSRAILGDSAAQALASVDQAELYTEVDRLVRQAKGAAPLPGGDGAGAEEAAEFGPEHGVGPEQRQRLAALAAELNAPGVSHPVTVERILQSTLTILGYKVRLKPIAYAETLAAIPTEPFTPSPAALQSSEDLLNRRLTNTGYVALEADVGARAQQAVKTLIEQHGPLVPPDAVEEAAGTIVVGEKALNAEHLAVAVRTAAYYDATWPTVTEARQFNPEFIVNLNALGIVCFQVLVSFLIARFHQFTGMILGMLVAAVGIGLSAFAGDSGFFGGGGIVWIVAAGILTFSFGEMMASPTSQEYVGRIAPRDRVALYMGYYFVAVALGNLFGGILSGQLYGKLARDLQRPDLMWLCFGAIMLATALIFLLYNKLALPARKPAPTESAA